MRFGLEARSAGRDYLQVLGLRYTARTTLLCILEAQYRDASSLGPLDGVGNPVRTVHDSGAEGDSGCRLVTRG